jgi:hypothetical protein
MIGQSHGVPELRPVHDLRTHERLWLEGSAQLAVEPALLIEIDPLADQRRPLAAVAALPGSVPEAYGPPNQRELKFRGPKFWVFLLRHRPSGSALCRGFLQAVTKALLNASRRLRHPSRSVPGTLTRGISWLGRLVQVGKSVARNKENAPS